MNKAKRPQRHNYVGRVLWKLHNVVRGRLEARLDRIDLTVAQMGTLLTLHEDSDLSTADLARSLHMTPQNLSLVVGKLEEAGYLERRPDARHGRIKRLAITDRGCETIHKASRELDAVDQEIVAGLSAPERSMMPRLLECCLASLEALPAVVTGHSHINLNKQKRKI
jgi:DNA-binding MarR family transcriptional regulator